MVLGSCKTNFSLCMPKRTTSAHGAEVQKLCPILRLCHTLGTGRQKNSKLLAAVWIYVSLGSGSRIQLNKAHVLNTKKKAFLIHSFLAFHSWYSFSQSKILLRQFFPFLRSHCICGFLGQEAYPSRRKHSKMQDSPASWLPIASRKESSQGGCNDQLPWAFCACKHLV